MNIKNKIKTQDRKTTFMKKIVKLFIRNRLKVMLVLWSAFFICFTGLHLYAMHKYMLYRISDSYARVRNGKSFNDGCDKRASLMELPLRHIKQSQGVFLRYSQVRDQDIAKIASIGFLTYYLYPTPVHYLKESSIAECDYFISRNSFSGRNRRFFIINDEDRNFEKIANNNDYVLLKRIED